MQASIHRIERSTSTLTAISVALAVFLTPAIAMSAIVAGRTPATFAVSSSGAATYAIPIWTPPGVGAVQLSLALAYNSRTPNGVLGTGWSLSGLSAISRCNKTWAQDGAPSGVLLSASDRFCLDGQQLKLVSGQYGQSGSTYATEIDNFSKIEAIDTSGNGPLKFKVTSKNGLIYHYGLTPDSQVKPGGGATIATWALSRIADRVEPVPNRIDITYTNDTANGTFRVASIAYPTTATSQGPFYEVIFSYAARPTSDIPSFYKFGFISREPNRLTAIAVRNYGSATPTKLYNLAYDQGAATSRSRLSTIQECSATNCLPATSITYQNGSTGWSSLLLSTGQTTINSPVAGPISIDLNGDGLMDIFYPKTVTSTTSRWWAILATPSGFGSPINSGVTTTNTDLELAGTFSGTGQQQLLLKVSGYWHLIQHNLGGYFTSTSTGVPAGSEFASVDWDGDGLADLASMVGTEMRVRRNITVPPGPVTFAAAPETVFNYTGGWNIAGGTSYWMKQSDYDGNGRGDLQFTTYFNTGFGNWVSWEILRSNGFGTPASHTAVTGSSVAPLPGDWNSDGCTDIISVTQVLLSNCAGGFSAITTGGSGTAQIAGDWDGDSRTDLLYINAANKIWYVVRSTGEGAAAPISTGTAAPNGTAWFSLDQDGDGLIDLAFVETTASNAIKYRLHNGATFPADLAISFVDGFGISQTQSYKTITRNNYTKHSDAAFPEQDFQAPLYVIDQSIASDGTGGTFLTQFWYYGARVHVQGRGFEGFHSRRSYDSRSSLYGYDYFARQFPHTGMQTGRALFQSNGTTPIASVVGAPGSQMLGTQQNQQRFFPFLAGSAESQYEFGGTLNGSLVTESATSTTYADGFGNPTLVSRTVTDKDPTSPFFNSSWQTSVNSSYANDTSSNCIGLPLSTSVTNSVPGQSPQTRTNVFSVDTLACRVTQQIVEPNIPEQKVTATLGFDSCGNVSTYSLVGSRPDGTAMPTRTSLLNYGLRCQLTERLTNALGHETEIGYAYDLGRPVTHTDPNDLITSWLIDDFGKVARETQPDQTSTDIAYTHCATPPCWGSADLRLLVTETYRDSAGGTINTRQQYFDGLERIRSDEFNRVLGVWTKNVRQYDSLGRITTEHQPYSAASNGYLTRTYDALGRVTLIRLYRPGGVLDRTTNIAYTGRTVTITDPLSRVSQRVLDVAANLRRVVDPSPGGLTSYDYDAFGNLNRIADPIGAVSTGQYNLRGFRMQWDDADRGLWTFVPNSLNELESWTNANSQSFSATYDPLGRLTSRTEPEGTSNWVWGNSMAAHNIGSLESASGLGYSEQLFYDGIGRLATRRIASDQQYNYDFTYNSIGALDSIIYPASPVPTGQTGSRFTARYLYSFGQPFQIQDVTEPTASTIWTLTAANDYSSATAESLSAGTIAVSSTYKAWTNEIESIRAGVGGSTTNRQNLAYQWDTVGNLSQRQDLNQGLTEIFAPDALDRVISSTLNGVQNLAVQYNAAGNILNKSPGPGAYTYGDANHPHAVTAAGPAVSLTYDANGNAITRSGLTQVWASFDLPTSLQATVDGSTWQSQFAYGPEHQRWRQIATYSNGTETTHYVGSLLEKVHATPTGVTYWRHYLHTPSGTTFIVSRNSDSSKAIAYVQSDHLGSSDAILDATGNLTFQESFSAFGERRGSNWSVTTPPNWAGIAEVTRRGFTWHEHLDNIRLIHMNGRVYDPGLGRFLSVDPIIGDISDSQHVNAYAYVGNRPLTSIDPTGLCGVNGGFCFYVGISLFGWGFGSGPPPPPPAVVWSSSAQTGQGSICDFATAVASCQGGVPNIGGPNRAPMILTLGVPRGMSMPGQPQSNCAECNEGDADDFVIGILTGAVDDTVRFIVIGAIRSQRGPQPSADAVAQFADERVIFGAPDSSLGQYGYDLGPGLLVVSGGWGVVKRLFTRAPVVLGTPIPQAARGVRYVDTVVPGEFGLASAGAAQVVRTLQTGGNKILKRTADGLNDALGRSAGRRDWGRALEGLKRDLGLPGAHHGQIRSTGDYVDEAGNVLGNLVDYLP